MVPYIHSEVASDPVVLEFLRKIGIRDADISGELSSCIAHGIHKFTEKDWHRFWSLAAAAGASAIELLRSRTDVSSLRVRTVSGEFQPLRSVLAPGTIADPKRDPHIAVDMEYHSNTMDLLQALGVSEKPVAGRGSLDESWGYKYRAVALETYNKTLTTRQRRSESYLNFFHTQCAGPLEPFIKLSEEGKAYFAEELLGLNRTGLDFRARQSVVVLSNNQISRPQCLACPQRGISTHVSGRSKHIAIGGKATESMVPIHASRGARH